MKKTTLPGDLDRLSELPDSLLLRILSPMEMKDVVKTGILSKRWKNLWTQVRNLVYKFSDDDVKRLPNETRRVARERHLKQFVSFIDMTLKHHDSDIKQFSLTAYWAGYFGDGDMNGLVNDWIGRVLAKKVEVLELDCDGLLYYAPDFLFQSSSLAELKLGNVVFGELSLPVRLNLLKSLRLARVSGLNDENVEKILFGCPVLESLALEMIGDLKRLNVISRSVRKLKLVDICYGGDDVGAMFTIRAPWIQELEMSGRFPVAKCQIEDVSSLVVATLAFTNYETTFRVAEDEELIDREMEFSVRWTDLVVPHLLRALSNVAELSIGTDLIQILSLAKFYGKPLPSFQCKHLTINSPLWNYDVLGISCLLENTPHLETLVINVCNYQYERPLDEARLFDDEDMDLNLPNGNFVHLQNVKIDYCRNPCTDNAEYVGGRCNHIELVGYIMRSVPALESLVLCSSRPGCTAMPGCSKVNCSFQYVPQLSRELLMEFLPRNDDEKCELKKRKYSYEYRCSNYASLRS